MMFRRLVFALAAIPALAQVDDGTVHDVAQRDPYPSEDSGDWSWGTPAPGNCGSRPQNGASCPQLPFTIGSSSAAPSMGLRARCIRSAIDASPDSVDIGI
jgi:hypothetical protein